jgi:hypothetical protein
LSDFTLRLAESISGVARVHIESERIDICLARSVLTLRGSPLHSPGSASRSAGFESHWGMPAFWWADRRLVCQNPHGSRQHRHPTCQDPQGERQPRLRYRQGPQRGWQDRLSTQQYPHCGCRVDV